MSASEKLRAPPANASKDRPVFFFDIDNTLYRKATGIGNLMHEYIARYIEETLDLPPEKADKLHQNYYHEYGLSIEGLVRENHVDAMDYNAKVDDALPLEKYLKPDQRLIDMLSRIDPTKYKLWLCTNAYLNHGLRVVKLLGIDHFFEGITYCDYRSEPMICKPMPKYFTGAMQDVGVQLIETANGSKPQPPVYFVDDSAINVDAAEKFGWKSIRVNEPDEVEEPGDTTAADLDPPLHPGCPNQIKYIWQLPAVCPEVFTS